ncbi:hypothetical protein GCM10010331_49350 [Streptomyces xanthochromogenes]|uniref:hypothetical protein n=1 Tax=Streptomyces xanthochromogenes TaxID=67384 RepID=UPI0016793C77|nr:hypothetical protein [Streptomyces xanthochromogenes]GHB55638.1 hypothetical protein GCM10010331_49350 [Streptomyces xanthochromogenes]
MNLTVTGLFVLVCIGLGIWLVRKKHHKKREVLAVSLFWILLVATPWGSGAVAKVQGALGNGVQVATTTVNSVSSK